MTEEQKHIDPTTEEEEAKQDTPAAQDLTNPDIVTKYKLAGEIVQDALREAVRLCVPGAKIVDICQTTDEYILKRTSGVFKGAKVSKGIGFPTCVSVNHVIDHFSPLEGDKTELKSGDMVKIDLGVNIAGYVAIGAHTIILKAEDEVIEGPKAQVLAAVHYAREAAQRTVKAGARGKDLSDILEKVAAEFGVNQIQNIVSHQIEHCRLDAKKSVINRPEPGQKTENIEFLPGEAYLIDIVMSTGEGKGREAGTRPTIFKREPDVQYQLKRNTSRAVFREINDKAPHYPFHLRCLEEKGANFGLVECQNHGLVTAYPVLLEREGQYVAHAKFTLLILPSGSDRITGLPLELEGLKLEHPEIRDEGLKEVLAQSFGKRKKKKKGKGKKKKGKGGKKKPSAATAEEEEEDDAAAEE